MATPLVSLKIQRSNHGQDMSTPLPRELQSAAFLDRLMARFRHVVEAKFMGVAVAAGGRWVEEMVDDQGRSNWI